MSTRQRVLDVLRGHEAHRIRFTFPAGGSNITINRHSFERVARAIDRNVVHVTPTTAFPPGVAAQYDGTSNTILTARILGRIDQGLVLHECGHAYFDITSTGITALDEESACYVIDALYFRMTGLARPRWNAALHAMAGTITDGILAHYAAGNPGVPAVDPLLWNALRLITIVHPVYIAGPAGTGGSYTHNG